MTFNVENETDAQFPFDSRALAAQVIGAVLDGERCPYEAEVNVLITDEAGIRSFNREYRGIDAGTDVLSFPNISFVRPADFSPAEESAADHFHPDSGELILGDIILSADRIFSQAREYGHSVMREFAFLVAHSALHLCGYDHETPGEAAVMEEKQEKILEHLGITREKADAVREKGTEKIG